MLKHISHSIAKPLTKLFIFSHTKKQLPFQWKHSHVTPIYKGKGDASSSCKCRPISLTGVVCKLLEKHIFKHLFNFIKTNNLLFKQQSGFQPNDSTVNQLIDIYNTIIGNLDKGKNVCFVLCDVAKAFDKV